MRNLLRNYPIYNSNRDQMVQMCSYLCHAMNQHSLNFRREVHARIDEVMASNGAKVILINDQFNFEAVSRRDIRIKRAPRAHLKEVVQDIGVYIATRKYQHQLDLFDQDDNAYWVYCANYEDFGKVKAQLNACGVNTKNLNWNRISGVIKVYKDHDFDAYACDFGTFMSDSYANTLLIPPNCVRLILKGSTKKNVVAPIHSDINRPQDIAFETWAMTKPSGSDMTHFAQIAYRVLAKKLAKEYKRLFDTPQDVDTLEVIFKSAIQLSVNNGNYFRSKAKDTNLGKIPMDVMQWCDTLRLMPCHDCRTLHPIHDMKRLSIDSVETPLLCQNCREKRVEGAVWCSSCNTWHKNSNTFAQFYDPRHCTFVKKCARANKISLDNYKQTTYGYVHKAMLTKEGRIADTRIGNYHEKSYHGEFRLDNDNSMLMGVELETYGNTSNAIFVNAMKEYFHCEHDGSLASGNSFEIISEPMTYNYWKSFRGQMDGLFQALKDHEHTEGSRGYGFHIHIDKKAFKDEDSVKWLIHNIQYHQRTIEKLARRKDNNGYYSYQCGNGGLRFVEDLTDNEIRDYFNDHSTCVNCHVGVSRTPTIEIRVFKSTLDTQVFYDTLRLVKNLVDMANNHSTSKRDLLRGIKDYAIAQGVHI